MYRTTIKYILYYIYFLVSFSLSMSSTPTVQRHEKFANVAKKNTCHDMSVSVFVLVSLNFKMLQHITCQLRNKEFRILLAILTIWEMNCAFPGDKSEKGIKTDKGTRSVCSKCSIRIFRFKIFNLKIKNQIFWVKNMKIWSLK